MSAAPTAFPASDAAASHPAPTSDTEAATAAIQEVPLLMVAAAGAGASNPAAAGLTAAVAGEAAPAPPRSSSFQDRRRVARAQVRGSAKRSLLSPSRVRRARKRGPSAPR